MMGRSKLVPRLTAVCLVLAMMSVGARAQTAEELSQAMLGELMGFVQNAYFNANRLSDMPKFPGGRAASQPEVLRAVASALQVRQRSCTSVLKVDYADDSGDKLAINCVGGNYMVDAKSGKITP